MFRRVYRAMDAQNPLGAGNPEIVGERHAVMRKSGAESSPGERRHPLTARAAVQIEAKRRFPAAYGLPVRVKNRRNGRVSLENRPETVLHGNAQSEVRPELLQQSQGGSRQNTIAQRAQTDDGDAGTLR